MPPKRRRNRFQGAGMSSKQRSDRKLAIDTEKTRSPLKVKVQQLGKTLYIIEKLSLTP